MRGSFDTELSLIMARTRNYQILSGRIKLEAEDRVGFIKFITSQRVPRIRYWVDDLGFPNANGDTKQAIIADYLVGMVWRDRGYWVRALRSYLLQGDETESWRWSMEFNKVILSQ